MLSTKEIGSIQKASHYYITEDDYYTRNDGLERSSWYGRGAEQLGLTGKVDSDKFKALLEGSVASEKLGIMRDGVWQHRAGFDLTFSSPKSVSIMRLVAEDERITQAETLAANYVLDRIERDCAQARKTINGETLCETTGNLIVAKFHHTLSRALDPASHIHAVVINATYRNDGKWRSLASQMGRYDKEANREVNGFIERVRHRKNFYGAIYREKLANELEKIGYEVIRKEGNYFDIVGVPQTVMDHFSKRKKDIDEYMEDRDLSGAKVAAAVTQITRERKKDVDRDQLKKDWQAEAKQLNFDYEALYKRSLANEAQHKHELNKEIELRSLGQRNADIAKDVNSTALLRVRMAVQHLMEKDYTMLTSDIVRTAGSLSMGEGEVHTETLIEAINALKSSGDLVALANRIDERRLTTRENIQNEIDIIAMARSEKDTVRRILSIEKADNFAFKQASLNQQDKESLATILKSTDRIICLTGQAGSQKHALLQSISSCYQDRAWEVVGLTHKGIDYVNMDRQLQRQADGKGILPWLKGLLGAQSIYTINKFVDDHNWRMNNARINVGKKLIVVDNAERCHPNTLKNLLEVVNRFDYKLILAGDLASASNYKANVFNKLTKEGITTFHCYRDEMTNQTHEGSVGAALRETLAGNIVGALEKIKGNIVAIKDNDERVASIANEYAQLAAKVRATTLILAQSKAQCEKLNRAVHEALVNQGVLEKEGRTIDVFTSKNLTEAQRHSASEYKKGEWVRFNVNCDGTGIRKHSYLQVSDVDKSSNTVILRDSARNKITWDPFKTMKEYKNGVEVYETTRHTFNVGDLIIFTRADQQKKLQKDEVCVITGFSKNMVSLDRSDGKSIKLNMSDPAMKHVTYGYARTSSQASHSSFDKVIATQLSSASQTNQKEFYGVLCLAKKDVVLYTDSKESYLNRVADTVGHKSTLISVLAKLDSYINLAKENETPDTIVKAKSMLQAALSDKNMPDMGREIRASFKYAIESLTDREAGFSTEVLTESVLEQLSKSLPKTGQYGLEETEKTIRQAIAILQVNGELLADPKTKDIAFGELTSGQELSKEKAIVDITKAAISSVSSLLTKEEALEKLNKTNLNPDQKQAALELLTTRNSIHIVQGAPGVGKTYTLKVVKDIIESSKPGEYKILGVAPTHPAVKELSKAGIDAMTVDSFISAVSKKELTLAANKTILYVDESSMLSNDKAKRLIDIIASHNLRSYEIGDYKQLPSPGSGKPFSLQQQVTDHATVMNKIIRQQNEHLLLAVEMQVREETKNSFSVLADDMISINHDSITSALAQGKLEQSDLIYKSSTALGKGEKIDFYATQVNKVANLYCAKMLNSKEEVLVITPSHADRKNVNQVIREKLIERDYLKANATGCQYSILERENNREAELASAFSYKPGQVILFCHDDYKLGIKRGEYWSVSKVYIDNNLLALSNDKGKTVIWEPIKHPKTNKVHVEKYNQQSRELVEGDKIIWTRTNREEGILGSEVMRVASATDSKLTLINDANKEVVIDPTQGKYKHWDYAYAITAHRAQGKTVDATILLMRSTQKILANKKNWLVDISRGRHELTVVTDDAEALCKQIDKNSGEKLSALEITGALPKGGGSGAKNPQLPGQHTQRVDKQSVLDDRLAAYKAKIDKINLYLSDNAEKVVTQLLGRPKSRTATNYTYSYSEQFGGESGKQMGGSLSVCISGEKSGLWHCFKTSEGGNLLLLVQKKLGLSFKDAVDESCRLLGIDGQSFNSNQFASKLGARQVTHSVSEGVPAQTSEKATMFINRTFKGSVPIEGTLAQRYLVEKRGLNINQIPSSLRFHPSFYTSESKQYLPALIAFVRDKKSELCAMQAIYLDKKTADKYRRLETEKRNHGSTKGRVVDVTVGKRTTDLALYAEGVETGLSLAQAMPGSQVNATLGKENFANIKVDPQTARAIICLDNDAPNSADPFKSDPSILKIVCKILNQNPNIDLLLTIPERVKDGNDLLRKEGEGAVRALVARAKSVREIFSKDELSTGELSSKEPKNDSKELDSDKEKLEKSAQKAEQTSDQKSTDRLIVNQYKQEEREH